MKPLILITNDDGIEARGIHFLAKAVSHLGDIVVVAPDSPRSGQSCAITVTNPLRLFKVKEEENIKYYKTTGTPVDCIKLAINECKNDGFNTFFIFLRKVICKFLFF